jgi:hypothetical protein
VAILNIAQDHIDWHGSFDEYANAKIKLLSHTQTAVLNLNDPEIILRGASWNGRKIFFGFDTPQAGEVGIVEELIIDRAFVTTADNLKANLASPIFTGTVTGSPAAGTTSTGTSGFGYMGLPQNATTTGAYGVLAADAGKHIYSTATRTVTIPANGTIAMPVGSTLVFIAGSGATVTIAITTDTLYLAGPGTTGSRTLAAFGMATAVKITATSWIISGNGLS